MVAYHTRDTTHAKPFWRAAVVFLIGNQFEIKVDIIENLDMLLRLAMNLNTARIIYLI